MLRIGYAGILTIGVETIAGLMPFVGFDTAKFQMILSVNKGRGRVTRGVSAIPELRLYYF